MSKSTWTGAVSSDWADADNWSPAGVPGASSDVVIAIGAPVAFRPRSGRSIRSPICPISTSSRRERIRSPPSSTTPVSWASTLTAGEGGTILNIGETLTNSHTLRIGNATLSASDEVTAAALDNTGRSI